MLHERLLHRVQPAVAGQPLDRDHLPARDVLQRHQAGPHGLAGHQDRARAAITLAASAFGAGQPKVVAQDREKLALAVRCDADGLLVERELNRLFHWRLPRWQMV